MIHKCAICGQLDYTQKIVIPQLEPYIADTSGLFSRKDMEHAPKVIWHGIKSSKKKYVINVLQKLS